MNILQDNYQRISVIFLTSALIAAVVAFYAVRYRRGGVWRYFVYTMIAIAVWSFSDAIFFLLAARDIERWFWVQSGYSASMLIPPIVFTFALHFARWEHWLTPKTRMVLWTPFVVAIVLAVTNPWHGLIWDREISPLALTGAPGHGFYFYAILPLSYGLALCAVIIFLQSFWRLHGIYQRQAIVLSVAVLLPLFSSLFFFSDLNPLPGVDFAPAAFAITGLLLLYSMIRLRLMDLHPIYRDAVFQHMSEGAVVLDGSGRIVDINPAAERILLRSAQSIGVDARHALAYGFVLADELNLSAGSHHLVMTLEEPPSYYDLRVTEIEGQPGALLIVWRDVTRVRMALAAISAQAQVLAARAEAEREFKLEVDNAVATLRCQVQSALDHLDHGRLGATAALLVQIDAATTENLRRRTLAFYGSGLRSTEFFGAVQQYVTHFAHTHALQLDIKIDGGLNSDHLAATTRLHAVHILQEMLDNVQRHAHAHSTVVSFASAPEGIILTVRDDGVGFDPDEVLPTATETGIAAMQRRTRLAGGTLAITTAPGAGVTVCALLPTVTGAAQLTTLRDRQTLLVVNRPLEREGLRAILVEKGMNVITPAPDPAALLDSVRTTQPDLILLDIDILQASTAVALQQVNVLCPAARIVILTEADHPDLPATLHTDADGFLLKTLPPDAFFDALAQIVSGESALAPQMARQIVAEFKAHTDTPAPQKPLTPRQQTILTMIGQGLTYNEIATHLHLSEGAVRYHVEQMRRRLGLANRSELALYARRHPTDKR